jgi:hypothetical protein
VIRRAHHLQEDRLFECYLAGRHGDSIDPPTAEHLADCEFCAGRYDDLASFMDTVRAGAESETDTIFTTERLRDQQREIVRRLEHIRRPARVISFPGRVVRRTMTSSVSRTAPRWTAAAAAAGLFVGVALGASYQYGAHPRQTAAAGARQPGALRTPGGASGDPVPIATRGSGQAQVATDDAALSDLELALERPHTRELLAFDAFTPHVREIRDR